MILTEEIENSLKNEANIDDLLKQIHDMDFSEYIHHLFKKYHLKEADIIRKSGLERTYAYKIIRGEKGKNAKDKIYRLALAMNLNQKETNHLLSLNNAGDLYPHNARDLLLLNGLLKKQRHLTFADTVYGPDFAPVAAETAARGYTPTFICESAGTQAEDALAMKRCYQTCKGE